MHVLLQFTCEPVETTVTNTLFNNSSNGINIYTKLHSPLVCPWPQYVVLTCCLACVSIAIAFPIYYGSLPTFRMKIGMLFVMTCVFAVAFVHFTHRHVFIAASLSSLTPSCCEQGNDIHYKQTMNNTVTNDHYHATTTNTTIRHDHIINDQQ